MKKVFTSSLAAFLILFSGISSAGTYPQGCNIKITSKGLKEGSMCLLACYYGDKNYIKDYMYEVFNDVLSQEIETDNL